MFKFNLFLLKLIVISPCHTTLTITQQELIVLLNKNLYIDNLFVMSDLSEKLNPNMISFVKLLSKNKIYVKYLSTFEAHETMPNSNFHSKILVLIDSEEKTNFVSMLFRVRNQHFLSNYIWAVFDEGDIENLKGIYIPYDCQFFVIKRTNEYMFKVFEIYHVKIDIKRMYKIYFGEWGRDKNFEWPKTDFYQRRLDLNKTILPAVSSHGATDCSTLEAFCAYLEITIEMARVMNFRFYDKTENQQKRKQMAENEIYIGLYVCDYYEYKKYAIGPIWKTSTYLHIKYDAKYEEGGCTSPYWRPFKMSVWITIILWILISGTCFFVVNFSVFHLSICKQSNRFNFIDNIFCSWELFNHQLGSDLPTITSSQIASLMMQIMPRFIMPLYSAIIISFITVQIASLPFADLEGLVKDGTFKIGYLKGTVVQKFFQKSNNPTLIESQRLIIDSRKMPMGELQGARLVCEDSKFAFVYFNNDLYDYDLPCKILQIPSPVYITWDCFVLRDFSSYNKIFNRLLKTFFSAGMIKRWERILFKKLPSQTPDTNPVKLEKLVRMYTLTTILYIISLFILIIEITYNWIKRKFSNKQKNDLLFIRTVCMYDCK